MHEWVKDVGKKFTLLIVWMLSADNRKALILWQNLQFLTKFFKIQMLIAIFGFSTKNTFIWVQTSLVLVQ